MPSSTGVPDGSNNPAVVRNLHFSNVLKPNASGNLSFYIVASPLGVVQQITGIAIGTNAYTADPATPSGIKGAAVTTVAGLLANNLTLNSTSPADETGATLRLVNAVHRITFTGSSLHNGGTVTVDQANLGRTQTSTIATSGNPRVVEVGFSGLKPNSPLSPLALAGPARNPCTLVHLPTDTEYHETRPLLSTPFDPGNSSGFGLSLLSKRYYFVSYTGLDTSATVTIDSRVCVQEELTAGSTAFTPFAKPSEFTSPGLLDTFLGRVGASRLYDWGHAQLMSLIRTAGNVAVNAITGVRLGAIQDL